MKFASIHQSFPCNDETIVIACYVSCETMRTVCQEKADSLITNYRLFDVTVDDEKLDVIEIQQREDIMRCCLMLVLKIKTDHTVEYFQNKKIIVDKIKFDVK